MIFAVRRTFRTAAVFLGVLGAFLAVGLFLLTVDRAAGTAMSLFAGFFLLIILIQTLRLGWHYAIAPEGIGLIVVEPGFAAVKSPAPRPSEEASRLTPREREVLELLARGPGTKQIA